MECGYCGKSKKRMSGFEAPNGERVPICIGCCKKHFGFSFKQLEALNKKVDKSSRAELLGFIIIKATLWANRLFKDEKKAEQWMTSVNSQFLGSSPLEVILRGNYSQVINFLEERLGRKSGAAF
ncbi:MAG: hypothetical protein Q7S73_02795 [bacterium]|nr:hypothetical protein [bacterium]